MPDTADTAIPNARAPDTGDTADTGDTVLQIEPPRIGALPVSSPCRRRWDRPIEQVLNTHGSRILDKRIRIEIGMRDDHLSLAHRRAERRYPAPARPVGA